MRLRALVILFLLPGIAVNGHAQRRNSVEDFKKVDSTMRETANNYAAEYDYRYWYKEISANRTKNERLAHEADTLFVNANRVVEYIDSLKQLLQIAETIDIINDSAVRLVINSHNGIKLRHLLYLFSNAAYSAIQTKDKRQKMDTWLTSVEQIISDDNWTKHYFDDAPSIGAITLLNMLKNNITSATILVLRDIKEHL